MSTRAIIALRVNGGYETAWCWNDGYPKGLGKDLRKNFNTEETIRELIDAHSFSIICGEDTKRELAETFPEALAKSRFVNLSNGRMLLVHPHMGEVVAGGERGFFKTIKEMLGQDLDYVYVFKNGKWKTHRA